MNQNPHSPGVIWINQETQGFVLSPNEIRERIERSRSGARRRRIFFATTALITVVTAAATLLLYDSPVVVWLRAIQVIAWVVLMALGPRLYLERTQLLSLSLASSSFPCLDFYRRELERQRDSFRPIPWMMAVISTFGLALAVFAPKHRSMMIALGILMILIAIAGYLRMRWAAPGVQRELDDLRNYERGFLS
jgi:hypothetical protein